MNPPWKRYCVLPNILILPTVTHCTSQQHTDVALLPVHCNKGYTKTPQYYDIRALPLLLCDMPSGRHTMGRSMDNRNCMFSCSTEYWAVETTLGDMVSKPSRSETGKSIEDLLVPRIEEGRLHWQKNRQHIELKQHFCELRHFSTKHFSQLENISTTSNLTIFTVFCIIKTILIPLNTDNFDYPSRQYRYPIDQNSLILPLFPHSLILL